VDTFHIGDKVVAPGYKNVVGVHTIIDIYEKHPFEHQCGYVLDGVRGVFMPFELRVVSQDTTIIDWADICNNTTADILLVHYCGNKHVFLVRKSWLQKAPQDMKFGTVWTVREELADKPDLDIPDGWNDYAVHETSIEMVKQNIAKIRNAMAGVTIEVV
jgi:hypothetical protein